jgi:hypothetical protein
MLLDAVDLATFGPLGLWVGFVLGSLTGWFLAESLGFKRGNRWMGGVLGGLYCMLPGTSVLPVATIVTALREFTDRGDETIAAAATPGRKPHARERPSEEPLTVDYREVNEDEPRLR